MTRWRWTAIASLSALAACATPPEPAAPPPEPAPPAVEPEPEPAPPPEPPKTDKRITIAMVGDMMIGTDYPDNRLPDDDGDSFLADVTPILRKADLAIGNLEGVLVEGGQPGKKCSSASSCYRFRSPPRYADHYKAAGFDVLSLANNHARDFGEGGRTATMRILDEAGILHSGRVGDFASFEVDGLRIAVLAYAVTRNSNMMLDYSGARKTVKQYAATHDIVIVSFHGGAEGRDVTRLPFDDEEYYDEPRGDVVRFARDVVDAGADLVFGHGPHVVRAIERYDDRLIAYSLGNFATYYGISVAGIKGVAPILVATLDGTGQFIEGEIVSTRQLRPDGPSIDKGKRALDLIRELSEQDFGEPGLEFKTDGKLVVAERPDIERREFEPDTDGDGGPVPCTEPWFWMLETVLGTGDGMGHGPDLGSGEWKSVIEFRLGLRNDPDLPAIDSPAWCAAIDAAVADVMKERIER